MLGSSVHTVVCVARSSLEVLGRLLHPFSRLSRPLAILAVAALAVSASASPSLPTIDYTETLQWGATYRLGDSNIYPAAVDGERLYLAGGGRMRVLNVADPYRPQVVLDSFIDFDIDGLLPSESTVYVASGDRLSVFEWDSGQLVERGFVAGTPRYPGMSVRDGLLALVRSDHLVLVDVEDPSSPTILSTVELGRRASTAHFRGSELLVFGETGVVHYDVSDPTSPVRGLVRSLGAPGPSTGWAVSSDYAFRSVGGSVSAFRLDAASNSAPLSEVTLDPPSSGLAVHGDRLWAGAHNFVHAVDISSPSNMSWVGSAEVRGGRPISGGDHLFLWDVHWGVSALGGTPRTPEFLGTWSSLKPNDFESVGTDLIILSGNGFYFVDAADPLHLEVHSAEDLQFPSSRVSHAEGLACVVAQSSLEIVDLSDPAAVSQVSRVWGPFSDVVAHGHSAYVSRRGGGLAVVHLGDGTSPAVIGEVDGVGARALLERDGAYLYAADEQGISVFEISTPDRPQLLRRVPFPDPVAHELTVLALGPERLAVASQGGAILLYERSDPAHPRKVDQYTLGPYIYSGTFSGTDLYVGRALFGVSVLEWSGSRPGRWASFHRRYFNARAIHAMGGAILVGEDHYAEPTVRILPRHVPAGAPVSTNVPGESPTLEPLPSLRLAGAFPNPFAHSTTIRFDAERPMRVGLAVFDVAGRRVATLREGVVPAGGHLVAWDGRDAAGRAVAGGVYFLRLDGDGVERTGKVTILRAP